MTQLIAVLTRNNRPAEVLDPKNFKSQLALRNSIFQGSEQFDALEFIQYFFEFLNEETSMSFDDSISSDDQLNHQLKAQDYLKKLSTKNKNHPLTNIF